MFVLPLIFNSIMALGFPNPQENACLRCHGNLAVQADSQPIAPTWALQFSMKWNMYEFKEGKIPPFDAIPAEHSVKRGETHYDWTERKMTEIYQDRCINIFPQGNEFSCQFLSVGPKTYLIKYPLGNLSKPESCCLISTDPFWAPRPDVLQTMKFQRQGSVDGRGVDWWILDIPMPGPFGYGTEQASNRPVAFWFPVINGWVQQSFYDYESGKPDPRVFQVPQDCKRNVSVCEL